ncbi:MAG: HNH endonuclease [Gammaproteobacteria bacterium]|nr:HNH endonuclease [Gammaproteobacteria bacterium]NNF61152.1 DUF222 domain-containing protein [Gammaproteobacteria bacterium]NNM19758.1 DUF222 domain-containing protein [Gammaproteobacteria bacterium]
MEVAARQAVRPFTPVPNPKLQHIEKLADQIGELAGYLNAANCRFLELVAEFDELGGYAEQGAASCAHWLNWKCGIGMNAAREKVRTARALVSLPDIHASFAAGRISYSKVRAMTRVATPENEGYLLDIALHGTASHVEKLVRGYRWRIRHDEEKAADEKHLEDRYCHYHWDDDGALVVRARLTPEQGALFLTALEAGREAAADVTAVTPEEPEPVEWPQRRADGLALMAETFLAKGPAALNGGDRHQVILIADSAVLRGDAETGECRIDNGPVISMHKMRRLGCDASRRHIALDHNGEPVSIGRKSRTIPPPMRRAMLLRDGGCRFPGCDRSRFVDGHHIEHWADGGETSLANLVTLCRHHHRLVHEEGFAVRRSGANHFEFKSPRGNVIPDAALPQPGQADVSPVPEIPVNKDTGACGWDGLPMDYGEAVEALQHLDGRLLH